MVGTRVARRELAMPSSPLLAVPLVYIKLFVGDFVCQVRYIIEKISNYIEFILNQ
jgi:hypothetical protein